MKKLINVINHHADFIMALIGLLVSCTLIYANITGNVLLARLSGGMDILVMLSLRDYLYIR